MMRNSLLGLLYRGRKSAPFFFMKTITFFSLVAILFVSCDPIKRIASDPQKLAKIAPEVIRAGYCIPDTIKIVKSDTMTIWDTLEIPVMIPDTIVSPGDTIRMIQIKRKVVQSVKYITNTITIRDTAVINRLADDLIIARDSIKIFQAEIRQRKKEKRQDMQLMGALGMTALISFMALFAIIRYTSKK